MATTPKNGKAHAVTALGSFFDAAASCVRADIFASYLRAGATVAHGLDGGATTAGATVPHGLAGGATTFTGTGGKFTVAQGFLRQHWC